VNRLNAPPEIVDDDPRLSTLMTRRLVAITPDSGAHVALNLMASAKVRHLPVLDDGVYVGMVVEPDLVLAVAEGELQRPGAPLTVASLCRRAAMLHAHDRRSLAATMMSETGIDAVLVVEGETLVGLVTATDLVRSLAGGPGVKGVAGAQSAHRPGRK
jgi:CBS domain-containing protein